MRPDVNPTPSIAPTMAPSIADDMPNDSTILVAHTIIGDETVIVDVGTSFIKVAEACQRHASDFARLTNKMDYDVYWAGPHGHHNRTVWGSYMAGLNYIIELRKVTS